MFSINLSKSSSSAEEGWLQHNNNFINFSFGISLISLIASCIKSSVTVVKDNADESDVSLFVLSLCTFLENKFSSISSM